MAEILPRIAGEKDKDYIARLQAHLAEATAKRNSINFKVSEKGALSVYGVNSRMPVTLYIDQWERLAPKMPDLLAFGKANAATLKRKPTTPATETPAAE